MRTGKGKLGKGDEISGLPAPGKDVVRSDAYRGEAMKPIYGTKEWFENKYHGVSEDPWGLSWRPSQEYRYLRMMQSLLKHMDPAAKYSLVVDLGCATGDFTARLKDHIHNGGIVTGVDISGTAIERARRKYPSVNFEEWSMDEIAGRYQKSLDIITCLESIYYLQPIERKKFISKIYTALRKGGLVLLSSLKARRPYVGLRELVELVDREFEVLEYGSINAKPLVDAEKTLIGFVNLLKSCGIDKRATFEGYMQRYLPLRRTIGMERIFRKVPNELAVSHVFVVARRPGK